MGGDLNLTLNSREVWGEAAREDPQAEFFAHLFEELNLVDVEPVKLLPTWRDSRRGRAGISKRLDRFLVARKVLE
jgi:hypothetical protein